MTRRIACIALGVAVLAASYDGAAAGFLRRAPEGDYAVAVSRYGNGTVTGPVRKTRTGYEVRLPGGVWVGCRTSCAETLRVETVDFFENDGRLAGYGTMQNECGIFGCLDWGRRW
jgi:hypothetical protein